MPKVSVVIPTKNRSALVAEAVDRIETQTVPREQYEVIVIDNDSADDTRTVLEQKAKAYSNFRFGFQEKPGAAATRNAGLRLAKNELIFSELNTRGMCTALWKGNIRLSPHVYNTPEEINTVLGVLMGM